MLAGLVNLHDVGVKQLGDGFRLGAKPRQPDLADMRSAKTIFRATRRCNRRCLAL